MKEIIPAEIISRKIFFIRGFKVMFDADLARMYGVPTKSLNLAVKRNAARFPEDFMFRLTAEEACNLRFQIETSRWGGRRHLPYAFTEQGVAMLSTVLKSDRAIEVNISIMRVFAKMRNMLLANKELSEELKKLENKVEKHDKEIQTIFEAIRQLISEPEKPRKRIGFTAGG
ncbi:MAG: DNA-binding protein [Elusimicrobia bacterium CG08_land_8_20_14_0_20_51_18]|nr:MAG: DNA-binding protein [Elusimicrobia bacterium CG08_land_8_20_14_0_20_51_18]